METSLSAQGDGIVSSIHTTDSLLDDYDDDSEDDDNDDDDSSSGTDGSQENEETENHDNSIANGTTDHTYSLENDETEPEGSHRVVVTGIPDSFYEVSSIASKGFEQNLIADSINDNDDDDDEVSIGSKSTNDILNTKEAPDTVTKRVWCTRILVLLALLIFGGVAGALTFTKMRDDELRDFEESFENVASEIMRVANEHGRKLASSMEAFAALYPSYGNEVEGTQLPLIMLNDFEAFAGSTRRVTRSSFLLFSPYLTQGTSQWNNFSVSHQSWIHRGFQLNDPAYTGHPADHEAIPAAVFYFNQENDMVNSTEQITSPIWQVSPPPVNTSIVNFDLMSDDSTRSFLNDIIKYEKPLLSNTVDALKIFAETQTEANSTSYSLYAHPVLSKFHGNHDVVGTVIALIYWDAFFTNALSKDAGTVTVVVESCGSFQTFLVSGTDVNYVAPLDAHDKNYDDMQEMDNNFVLNNIDLPDSCQHVIYVYPSREFQDMYESSQPAAFLILVIFIFLFAIVVFLLYDMIAGFRQKTTQRTANEQDALAEKFFPSHVRKQLINVAAASNEFRISDPKKKKARGQKKDSGATDLSTGSLGSHEQIYQVIADLYPETTIMFADIPGFTAWSSIREPPHIFMLLEAIFLAFDKTAKRRKVFKVETVGDCYVAAVGVPEANKDHAVIMARFAKSCLKTFDDIVRSLELTLGPDTSELGIRIGLHSGPITAGVLRGDRARFQLFGDTMNTTARIQTTGCRDCIHLSEQTASFLMAAGKKHWVLPRPDPVQAKGKGIMTTFWLKAPARGDPTEYSSSGYDSTAGADLSDVSEDEFENPEVALNLLESKLHTEDKSSLLNERAEPHVSPINSRLVAWNCELLSQHLKRIIAHRKAKNTLQESASSALNMTKIIKKDVMVVDEVVEVIALPEFDKDLLIEDPRSIQLSSELQRQLEGYVQTISCMYRDNPFHNFEHASHVTMSVSKLLSRIVAPQSPLGKQLSSKDLMKDQHELHDHTYGITSDPLTQFAVVLSALVHDVDHRGVPNFVLAKEDKAMAGAYQHKSIAEQNSVDIAWETLFLDEYKELRDAIFTTETELRRFRQLLVNSVIATDIFDKELSAARKVRWEKSFSKKSTDLKEDIDRKATIVIEHLIQASDVAHTMQHWQVYQKWNSRLFQEMYGAYLSGRTDSDPSVRWYEGEIGFFDNYIIPLAKKLKDCGVFGVSSDEYLNYAENNRRQWEEKGQSVVAEMIQKMKEQRLR